MKCNEDICLTDRTTRAIHSPKDLVLITLSVCLYRIDRDLIVNNNVQESIRSVYQVGVIRQLNKLLRSNQLILRPVLNI